MKHRRTLHLRDPQRDLDEEIAFYFESLVSDLVATGMARPDAEAEARQRFGDEERYRWELAQIDDAYVRRLRWSDRLDALRFTLHSAFRSMSRAKALSFGIILTFALGIGANATVFQVIDRLLLRAPPHLREPGALRIYTLHGRLPETGREFYTAIHSYPTVADLRGVPGIEGVAGFNFSTRDFTIGSGSEARRVKGLPVGGNFFSLLGVRPALGRLLDGQDDRIGAEPVVVLSYGYWQKQYSGDAGVIGRPIDFGTGRHTIVGVLPRGFTGIELTPVDLFLAIVPWRANVDRPDWQLSRRNLWLKVAIRLAPGTDVRGLEAQLTARAAAVGAELKAPATRVQRDVVLASLIPGESPLAPAEVRVSKWLVAVALLVLLVASINVANLLLARALRETRALAIRLALGVTRARLIGQVALEVVLFALLGSGAALLVARAGGALIQRVFLPDLAWDAIGYDSLVVWLTIALALTAALAAAALPAVQMLRPNVMETMRSSSAAIAGGSSRLRATLVVLQVALSAVLLTGASLFVRSARSAGHTDLGIDVENAWFLSLVNDEEFADPEAVFARGAAALAEVPGVEAAASTSTLPFFNQLGAALRVEGRDSLPGRTLVHSVSSDYFRALGLQLLGGRLLGADDEAGAERVAVVNHAFATRIFPRGAVGHCIYVGDNETRCTRIVGVVEDALLNGIGSDTMMQFYLPAPRRHDAFAPAAVDELLKPHLAGPQKAEPFPPVGFDVRLRRGAPVARTLAAARAALSAVDPRVRYVEAEALSDMIAFQMRPWRLGAVLFTIFGVLALVMATLGLYGVVAFDVTQRTKELGLRAALGASADRLVGLIVRDALGIATAGVALGLVISLVAAPRLQQLLYSVSARDATSRLVVALVLVGAAVTAAAVPAFRAARVHPMRVLRSE